MRIVWRAKANPMLLFKRFVRKWKSSRAKLLRSAMNEDNEVERGETIYWKKKVVSKGRKDKQQEMINLCRVEQSSNDGKSFSPFNLFSIKNVKRRRNQKNFFFLLPRKIIYSFFFLPLFTSNYFFFLSVHFDHQRKPN